jgi:Na+/proline symporter|eukprot:COSAG01_NODE_1504_length_10094_cov_24.449925_7_plen_201_part_00
MRLVGSALFVMRIFLYLGQALYAPALALEAVGGVPIELTVLVAGGVSAAYTVHGGMRAVIWTDIAQFFVLWGGQLILTVGAWGGTTGSVVDIARNGSRFDWLVNPGSVELTNDYNFWNVAVGSIPLTLVQVATDQIAVQRYLTASSVAEAQRGACRSRRTAAPLSLHSLGPAARRRAPQLPLTEKHSHHLRVRACVVNVL